MFDLDNNCIPSLAGWGYEDVEGLSIGLSIKMLKADLNYKRRRFGSLRVEGGFTLLDATVLLWQLLAGGIYEDVVVLRKKNHPGSC